MNEWEEVKDCRECRAEVNKVCRVPEKDSHWMEDSSWSLSCHELLLFQVEALLRQQEVSTSSSNVDVEALLCFPENFENWPK
jgi:hypothetical protein